MKKIFYLALMALPLAFLANSCHDDGDDLPDVTFQMTIENATNVDGVIYVVQGEELKISSIDVQNRDTSKKALITAANYYWDGFFLGYNLVSPFAFDIEITDRTPVGRHELEIESSVVAVDKSPAVALCVYPVMVVASAEEIPEGGATYFTVHPTISDSSKANR